MEPRPTPSNNILGVAGFQDGHDYRLGDAWKELAASRKESLVSCARDWIEASRSPDDSPVEIERTKEAFYKAVIETSGLEIDVEKIRAPHPYEHTYGLLRNLYDALKSEAIVAPQKSQLHSVESTLHASEAKTVRDLRNAALQQAEEEYKSQNRTPGAREL